MVKYSYLFACWGLEDQCKRTPGPYNHPARDRSRVKRVARRRKSSGNSHLNFAVQKLACNSSLRFFLHLFFPPSRYFLSFSSLFSAYRGCTFPALFFARTDPRFRHPPAEGGGFDSSPGARKIISLNWSVFGDPFLRDTEGVLNSERAESCKHAIR